MLPAADGAGQMLDQGKVGAAENSAIGCQSADVAEQCCGAVSDHGVEPCFRRAAFDCAGKLRAGLLNDTHARTALADFLRVDVRCDGACGAEYGDHVGVVLLRYCGVATAHGVWVAASTVGAMMPDMRTIGKRRVRQPIALQGAGGDRGRGIAAEQDEAAAGLKQIGDTGAGQRHNFFCRRLPYGTLA